MHDDRRPMDTLTTEQRSERMSRIRSKDTKPELAVRGLLHGLGYRYRLHKIGLPGKPDLVFSARKKIIFVHGCFWHSHEGCKIANQPKSRSAFWQSKFARNKTRDRSNIMQLRGSGWDTITIWECETKNLPKVGQRLTKFLGPARISSGRGNRYG